jgi:CRP/FNR family cyclic AMP-dependent transcriptional regulator
MDTRIDPALLATLALFQGLTPDQLEVIATHLRRRTIPAGTLLITVEQPGEAAYLIEQGTVKVAVEQTDGTEVILGLRGPGELVGEMSLIDQESRSANIVSLERCSLLWVDRTTFDQWLHNMPPLTFNLLKLLSRRLRLAGAQILSLSTLDVYGRVARQILTFAQEYGEPGADGTVLIPLRLTQSDLAALVGASRVRVNEVMVDYKRLNYLDVDARYRITVRKPDALARRSQSA